ncbi:MAG: hypothetical protein WCK43_05570, partial [bacterium]
YLGFDSSGKIAQSTGVVRRPRFLLRIETGDSFCAPTCQVSSLGDSELESSFVGQSTKEGNVPKSQSFCVGSVRVLNNESDAFKIDVKDTKNTSGLSVYNSTKASIPVTIWNDGPGYLYNYSLKKSFKPNPDYSYAPGEGISATEIFYQTFDSNEKLGVGPGKSSQTIYDEGLRCFDEKITSIKAASDVMSKLQAKYMSVDTHNHLYDGGGYWKTEYTPIEYKDSVLMVDSITASSSNPKSSGTVTYSFSQVESPNALYLSTMDEDLAGTKTTTVKTRTDTYLTYETPIVLYNTGMN